jgi:hypothetical protein
MVKRRTGRNLRFWRAVRHAISSCFNSKRNLCLAELEAFVAKCDDRPHIRARLCSGAATIFGFDGGIKVFAIPIIRCTDRSAYSVWLPCAPIICNSFLDGKHTSKIALVFSTHASGGRVLMSSFAK